MKGDCIPGWFTALAAGGKKTPLGTLGGPGAGGAPAATAVGEDESRDEVREDPIEGGTEEERAMRSDRNKNKIRFLSRRTSELLVITKGGPRNLSFSVELPDEFPILRQYR
jgi:hypothetical protein